MKDLNLELLNETYNRVVKLFKDYSNLNIFLKETLHNELLGKTSEIYILYKNDHRSKITFKKNLYNLKIDNIYSFLFSRDISFRYQYNNGSIFEFAKRCRQFYQNCPNKLNNVSYELYSSEAGRIIKELGFPTCPEEFAMKMDLLGI